MTKTILATAVSATLFTATANVSAANVYQGFADNPDLVHQYNTVDTTAMQPGIGSDIDRYHGVADDNADLFNVMLDGQSSSHETPQIYAGAEGNPDLAF